MKYIFLILLTLNSLALGSSIEIVGSRDKLIIGQQLEILTTIHYPKGSELYYPDFEGETIGVFERINSDLLKRDESGSDVVEVWKHKYATFEDPGNYHFGPVRVEVRNGEEITSLRSDSLAIEVFSILKEGAISAIDSTGKAVNLPLDSLQTILPIKGVVKYKLSSEEKMIIGSIIGGIILTITIIYLLIKKRSTGTIKPVKKVKIIPPYIIALEKLRVLRSKDLLKKGEFKLFASEISILIREYIEKQYKFNAAELPTSDILREVEGKLDKALMGNLEELLNLTDLVKFAKHIPLADELSRFLDESEQFINKTKDSSEEVANG